MTVGLSDAFVAGLRTLGTPCTQALVPVFLVGLFGSLFSFNQLGNETGRVTVVVLGAALFVLGFCFSFVSLALPGSSAEMILSATSTPVSGIVGALITGYALTALLRWRLPSWLRGVPNGHWIVLALAYLTGSAFAVNWIPCVGPTLGSILSNSPTAGTALSKSSLLLSYSLGMMVPFFAISLFMGLGLRSKVPGAVLSAFIVRMGGLLLLILGVALLTGSISYPLRYLGSF
jgi:cytochrome c-type biogenesis protein